MDINLTPEAARLQMLHHFPRPDWYAVTPTLAEVAKASSKGNRNLNLKTVERYTNDILNDRWAENGESIVVDSDGALRDGHHRCEAIIRADRTIRAAVIPGVAPSTEHGADIQTTMDGGANRTTGQALLMAGAPNASAAAAVVKAILINGEDGFSASAPKISNHSIDEFYRDNVELVQTIVRWGSRIKRATYAPAISYHTFLYQAYKNVGYSVTEDFVSDLTDVAKGGAVAVGRSKFLGIGTNGNGVRLAAYRVFRFTFDSWKKGLSTVRMTVDKPLPAWK